MSQYSEQREDLGKLVRETWLQWAKEQPDHSMHPHWLIPWDLLTERDREVDRRIGEAVALKIQEEWAMFHEAHDAEASAYRIVRACIMEHLPYVEDDIAEVAILCDAIERAGARLAHLRPTEVA